MRKSIRTFSASSVGKVGRTILPLLLVCAPTGCSKDKPASEWAVTGRVIDSQGAPVAAARVAIDFSTASQSNSAQTRNHHTHAGLAGTARDSTCMEITDLCGEAVTAIRCGPETCEWSGRNGSGQIVPPGLYRARIGSCDSSNASVEHLLFVKPIDLGRIIGPSLGHLEITDAQGKFAIGSCVMATNMSFDCWNDTGSPDTCFVSDSITVFAWSDSLWGKTTALYSPKQTTDVQIHLQIPINGNTNSQLPDDVLLPIGL